jgi:hypothetical protein
MKPTRAVPLSSFSTVWTALGALALACSGAACHAHTAPAGERVGTAPSPPFESSVPPSVKPEPPLAPERRAQRAWCSYLDALYRRAAADGSAWSDLAPCIAATSTAAPELLEKTAECSRVALEGFAGDPFTDAYAAEVKRCGTIALEAAALSPAEVTPYVSVMCQRAVSCGRAEPGDCLTEVSVQLGPRLGRALGALNEPSRLALRRCLRTVECESPEEQLSTCIDPMLDHLLWMPR